MDVLSLTPGYLSLCAHSASRVQVSTCDPGDLPIQFSYPISPQVHVSSRGSWLGEFVFPYTCYPGLGYGKVEPFRAWIGEDFS